MEPKCYSVKDKREMQKKKKNPKMYFVNSEQEVIMSE